MVNVSHLIVVINLILFVRIVLSSVGNNDKENEISGSLTIDGVEEKSKSKSSGHCSSDDCYEFKPFQIYIPHSPLIPCDKV